MPLDSTIPGPRALSLRAPWWWFVLYAGKDIENRDWRTNFRGEVLIHASAWWSANDVRAEFLDARAIAERQGVLLPPTSLAELRALGGHIVGAAEIIDCVEESASPWFFGRYGLVLARARPFAQPIPCKGALGFFTPSYARPDPPPVDTRQGALFA